MAIIDRYLPHWHFGERHRIRVHAAPDVILAAAASHRPERDPFFRRMIALREAPLRAARALRRTADALPPPFGMDRFTLLARDDAELVYGLAGRFWRVDYALAAVADGPAFERWDVPGSARLAMNFAVRADGAGGAILSTETRVAGTDVAGRRAFAPYWYLIRPVSGVIRRRTLHAIRVASERRLA